MRATLILGAVTMMALGACDQARPEHAVASLGASSPDALLDELRRMRPAASSAPGPQPPPPPTRPFGAVEAPAVGRRSRPRWTSTTPWPRAATGSARATP